MELQGLQEALKVEIQCHQKLAVRSCPVGNTKPISLIKPPNQSIAISVVPAKNPVSMVTAHINGQKAASTEPLQTAPINLQTANKVVGSSLNSTGRRVTELPNSQMLGTITAMPIKVPQVSSLHRLAGQAPTVLPQVRPKTLIPDSLPHSPCQEQLSSQQQSLQKATVVSIKNPGPALPTANNTVSHISLPNGQPIPPGLSEPPSVSTAISTAGVAYAIISTSPSGNTSGNTMSVVNEAIKVQPLLISTDSKVIIIQPQVQSGPQSQPEPKPESPAQEPVQAPPPPAKKRREEDPEKIAFMVALGLVTTEHLEEIQSKRQERKRRSTANPAYSGLFEPERKRLASNYLNHPLFLTARANEDLCWKDDIVHDKHCSVCKEDGELQQCHSCSRAYHPDCLDPPLKTPPKGVWVCPKCHKKVINKDNMSWPQNLTVVQSYITHKTVKEEEKRKLLKRSSELQGEHAQLEDREQQLSDSLAQCMDLKNNLLGKQKETQSSLERLKALIRLIQRDQMIQVTMTATTTTTGASLLTLPWIKPPSAAAPSSAGPSAHAQKGLPQTQGNN
ncbi:PHD finger protein 21B isoform X2 [Amia ocellicauda]|uniref:PHD finger protein 21B isoform X2 n=1 Tax=Amia ocellicauda TaxID=2972642 RepID=UPI003464361F|nr:PF21B protein [Amia calva]